MYYMINELIEVTVNTTAEITRCNMLTIHTCWRNNDTACNEEYDITEYNPYISPTFLE